MGGRGEHDRENEQWKSTSEMRVVNLVGGVNLCGSRQISAEPGS